MNGRTYYRHHLHVRRVLFLALSGRYLKGIAIADGRIELAWTRTAAEAFACSPGPFADAVSELCSVSLDPVLVRLLPYAPPACDCWDCRYYQPGYPR